MASPSATPKSRKAGLHIHRALYAVSLREEQKMSSRLIEIFEDTKLVNRIKNKLPYLFQLAELESSRAGKIGMEVGS